MCVSVCAQRVYLLVLISVGIGCLPTHCHLRKGVQLNLELSNWLDLLSIIPVPVLPSSFSELWFYKL